MISYAAITLAGPTTSTTTATDEVTVAGILPLRLPLLVVALVVDGLLWPHYYVNTDSSGDVYCNPNIMWIQIVVEMSIVTPILCEYR